MLSRTNMADIDTTELSIERDYVPYSDEVEVIEPDETETFQKIAKVMGDAMHGGREKYGRSVRASHAKAHGLLKGELRVIEGLPEHLRQGLFADGGTFPVVVRLAHVPGEFLDDRKVSTPRGMSIKIFGVKGTMLPLHEGEVTQDFVLSTGTAFNAPGPKVFLTAISGVASTAPHLPTGLKGFVSDLSRLTNEGLNKLGANSANLDFFGHPFNHPLGEAYYSQAPLRYGNYIAKLSVRPDTPGLRELAKKDFEPQDENGLRTAVVDFFRTNQAEFEVGIQLCVDRDHMPIEDASVEWPETESPYLPVARLVLPVQDAYSESRQQFVNESLMFSPAHSLNAHRPLGGLNRARIYTYQVLGNDRRTENGVPAREPRSIDEMPQ